MSLPALPSCLTVLPVVGRSSPLTLIGEGFGTFSIVASVLFWLIFRLTCCANTLRRMVFSCMCWWVCESCANSSAKSRFSRVEKKVHLKPCGQYDVCCRITQSIVRLKSNAGIRTTLSNTSPHTEAEFAVFHSALEVIKTQRQRSKDYERELYGSGTRQMRSFQPTVPDPRRCEVSWTVI